MQRGLDIRADNRYEDESAKAGGKSEYLQRRESCPGSGAARDLYNFYLLLLLQKLPHKVKIAEVHHVVIGVIHPAAVAAEPLQIAEAAVVIPVPGEVRELLGIHVDLIK